MIQKAYIEEYGNGKMEPEMSDLREEFQRRGIPVEAFTAKRIQRRQLSLTRETLVAGTISVVEGALRQIGIKPPETNDYPSCLEPFLHRRIWESTLRNMISRVHDGISEPLFVKPLGRRKRFTGNVFATPTDLMFLEGTSRSLPVYCSDVVEWRSEYRAFIINGQIVGLRRYSGDSQALPDESVIKEAVARYQDSGEAPAAYAIDFGVLRDGRTALVEINDGFSIGSYGLDKSAYADLTITRWCELVGLQNQMVR